MMKEYLPGRYFTGFSPQLNFFFPWSIALSSLLWLMMKFMTLSDILYILRQSIIQLCGTISLALYNYHHHFYYQFDYYYHYYSYCLVFAVVFVVFTAVFAVATVVVIIKYN